MIFRSRRLNFWTRRGITSLEENGVDQDQDLQGLPEHESRTPPQTETSSPPWSTLHNTPPSEEESRQ